MIGIQHDIFHWKSNVFICEWIINGVLGNAQFLSWCLMTLTDENDDEMLRFYLGC